MIQVEDLQKYLEVSKAPLLINSCTTDPQFPPEKIEAADRILGGGKFAPGYERVHWEGCTHGFAVRGDVVRLSSLFGFSSCLSPPLSVHCLLTFTRYIHISSSEPDADRRLIIVFLL